MTLGSLAPAIWIDWPGRKRHYGAGMTSGITFILHAPADAAYAAELAEALSPISAFAVALPNAGARPTLYGMGAVCVVVWSKAAAAQGVALTGLTNTVICSVGDAPPPRIVGSESIAHLRAQGAASADAPRLRSVIEDIQMRLAERSTRGSATPALAAAAHRGAIGLSDNGKNRMAVRSAWGLAATLAVVSVAAPVVGARAGAANIAANDQDDAVSQIAATTPVEQVQAVALNDAGDIVQVASTPAVLRPVETEQELALASYVAETTSAPISIEPVSLEAVPVIEDIFARSTLDPKAAGVIAAMVAGTSAMSDWKIDASAPASQPVAALKPAQEAAKPTSGA